MNPRIAVAAAVAATLTAVAPVLLAAPQGDAAKRTPMQFDKNGDGLISRDEAQASARLAASFDKLDVDKDGQLTRDELRAGRSKTGDGHRARLDTNKDGLISREEAKPTQRLSQNFDALDTNKDGQLSAEELRATRNRGSMASLDANKDGTISREEAKASPRIARSFDAIDADKDGQLTREELAAWRKAHAQHARQSQSAPAKP